MYFPLLVVLSTVLSAGMTWLLTAKINHEQPPLKQLSQEDRLLVTMAIPLFVAIILVLASLLTIVITLLMSLSL